MSLSSISSILEKEEFAPGDVLFNEGEQSFHFFILEEGSVEILKNAEDGSQITLAVVSEGSIGEFAMIDRQPRSATARAVSHVKAVRVSEAAYEQLLAELPEWAVAVMKSLVERLRHTNEIVRGIREVSEINRAKVESVEYDNEGGTVLDENPFLSDFDPDNDTDAIKTHK